MHISRSLTAAAVVFSLAGAAVAQPVAEQAAPLPAPAAAAPSLTIAPAGDIVDTMKASGQFTIVLKALDSSNLTAFLKSPGPFTVFAPTDAAFQALPPGQLDALLKPENAAQLQALLAYHLINAAVPLSKIQGTKGPIPSAAGTDIAVDGTATPIQVNDAHVLGEAQVSNGDIYAVDKVLTPPAAH